MSSRLRSRRGALALTFALSVLLVVFMTTMASMMALSVAGVAVRARPWSARRRCTPPRPG